MISSGFKYLIVNILGDVNQIYTLKAQIKLDGIVVKWGQFTENGYRGSGLRMMVVPIITTQSCQAKFYWTGPLANFSIYTPGSTTNIGERTFEKIASGT